MSKISVVEFANLGSTQSSFSLTFTYLNSNDVTAFVDGISVFTAGASTGTAVGSNTYTVAFDASNSSTLNFTPTVPAGSTVRIERNTNLTTKIVDFADGAVLTEESLDSAIDQVFFASQEAIDKTQDTIRVVADAKFDALSKVIKNVAVPVSANDAVNKTYLENTWLSTGDKTQLNALNLTNLNTVAGINTEINALHTIRTDITAVENIKTEIQAVENISTQIATVGLSNNVTNIGLVATDLALGAPRINTVASNITNVNAVGDSTVITNMANLNATGVVANIANLNASGVIANIGTVAGIDTKINTLAGLETEINTVNTINAAVTTVAGISTNVSTLANASVISNMANLNASGVVTNIGTVATDLNLGASSTIKNAEANATSALASKNEINTKFLGNHTPATRPASPATGSIYFDTSTSKLMVYTGSTFSVAVFDTAGALLSGSAISLLTNDAAYLTTVAYADVTAKPTLGTASPLNAGTTANNLVQLNGSAQLPAVDGSQLTGIAGSTAATTMKYGAL